jgi:hypothetical protein
MRLWEKRHAAGGHRWEWHPRGQDEYEQLRAGLTYLWAAVTARLVRLGAPKKAEQCRSVRGRVRRHQFQIDVTWVTVLFVIRLDGRGLGGLHLTTGQDDRIPDEAYDLARSRLGDMSGW